MTPAARTRAIPPLSSPPAPQTALAHCPLPPVSPSGAPWDKPGLRHALRALLPRAGAAALSPAPGDGPSDDTSAAWSAALCRGIKRWEAFREADGLLLFSPIGCEPDLLPLARAAAQEGRFVAFPRCLAEGGMAFFLCSPQALRPDRFGIPAPPSDAPAAPLSHRTLCLAPGLLFDPSGIRLGHGGGYYDRFFAVFPGRRVGVVPQYGLFPRLPRDGWDLPLHALALPWGVLPCPVVGIL